MKYYYNKLVRDKIVQNIKNKGSKVDFKVLNTEEYKKTDYGEYLFNFAER